MGKLILFGNLLGESENPSSLFAPLYGELVSQIDGMIGESESGARRFLAHFRTKLKMPVHHIPVALFRKKTDQSEVSFLLEPVEKGETWGYVSDAGLPCVADPGHLLVRRCMQKKIPFTACLGPSSLFYALVLSGLDGNRFAFNGYFPKEPIARKEAVRLAYKRAQIEGSVQIFIEAPYRNWASFETVLEVLDEKATLCLAQDLMLPSQQVVTQSILKWRSNPPKLEKVPMVFLIA